jgi:hypothetical protein
MMLVVFLSTNTSHNVNIISESFRNAYELYFFYKKMQLLPCDFMLKSLLQKKVFFWNFYTIWYTVSIITKYLQYYERFKRYHINK